MNREDKIEVFKMRLDGFTYQEIAEKYGVSRRLDQVNFRIKEWE